MAPITLPVKFTELALRWQKPPAGTRLKSRQEFLKSSRDHIESDFRQAEATGFVETCTHRGRVIGFLLFLKPGRFMVKGQRNIALYFDPREEKAFARWLKGRLRARRKEFNTRTTGGISARDAKRLIPVYRAAGFRIHSEILAGETEKALRRLLKAKNPPLKIEGLEIRPLKLKELPSAMRLQKRLFSRIPDRGFFSHTTYRLRSDEKDMRAIIKNPREGRIYGIFRGKRLMGFFGVFVHSHAALGSSGGFSLNFDFPIQKKGVAKTAYRHMLEYLVKRKVPTFQGGTSQPAVKGLADIMGRRPRSYLMIFKG